MDKIERTIRDGAVSVRRIKDGDFDMVCIQAIDLGAQSTMLVTEYNARRILAMLSQILGLPLSKAAQKEIEL